MLREETDLSRKRQEGRNMVAQYTDKQLEQIARAFARADEAKLRTRVVHMPWSGETYWLVESQRADQGHAPQRVSHDGGCTCEAMAYGRVPVCIHIATVIIRNRRMRKRGTAATARRLAEPYVA